MNQLIILFENFLGPFFAVILGGYGDQLFERILFFFIIMSVVYVVISKREPFKGKKPIIWIITIAVSLLSTRYLSENNLVQGVILPYGLFGVLITSALPFVIYFTFVASFRSSAMVRKVLWIFFIVTYFGIWSSRYDDLGELSWIYFVTAIVSILALMFDGTIQTQIRKGKERKKDLSRSSLSVAEDLKKLEELDDHLRENRITSEVHRDKTDEILKEIERKRKYARRRFK